MGALKKYTLKLTVAGNTASPAVAVMRARGYAISCSYTRCSGESDYRIFWEAEKDGRIFGSSEPEEVLGLIAMWEARGDDWQATDEEIEFALKLRQDGIVYDEDGNVIDESR